jgi:hypothetical protein
VYLALSFAASDRPTVRARSTKISWRRIRAGRRRTLRFPSEQLLQAIAKSLQVGLFGSLRCALVSHIDEGRDKLEVGRLQRFSVIPHNKHNSISDQLVVMPSMFWQQNIEHTEIDTIPSNDDSRSPTQRPSTKPKLPNRSARRKPEIWTSNPLPFGPTIRYLGQGCHLTL